MRKNRIALLIALSVALFGALAPNLFASFVTFSGGVMTVTPEGVQAGRDSVQDGIIMAFGVLAFLGILAMAMGGRFILNFIMSIPSKVFGGIGGGK